MITRRLLGTKSPVNRLMQIDNSPHHRNRQHRSRGTAIIFGPIKRLSRDATSDAPGPHHTPNHNPTSNPNLRNKVAKTIFDTAGGPLD
ncbi:hypothetical protein N9D38_05790 [Rubripirellula sp.]|nr:hypothetical protein [Rubripirellula sp.]